MSALLVMQLTLALLFAWALLSPAPAGPDRR
jgi:hypothetical protein